MFSEHCPVDIALIIATSAFLLFGCICELSFSSMSSGPGAHCYCIVSTSKCLSNRTSNATGLLGSTCKCCSSKMVLVLSDVSEFSDAR